MLAEVMVKVPLVIDCPKSSAPMHAASRDNISLGSRDIVVITDSVGVEGGCPRANISKLRTVKPQTVLKVPEILEGWKADQQAANAASLRCCCDNYF